MHEVDPEDRSTVLRAALERKQAQWSNRIASYEVTPSMLLHTDGPHCKCPRPECEAMVKQALPDKLRNTNHRRLVGPGQMIRRRVAMAVEPPGPEVGSKPRPRYDSKMNMPVQSPVWSTFFNKTMR